MKSVDSAAHPSYRLKLKYPICFSVSYVQLVTQQFESRIVFEKHLCNQGSHYENFPSCKGSHNVQPPNQPFSLLAG